MDKVLILLPPEDQTFEVLPFLISLHTHLNEPEINLLATYPQNSAYDYVSLELKYYQVKEEELGLIYCGQLAHRLHDIFNISHFFSLRESARYAYVGRAFRSNKKVGFAKGLKKVVFDHSLEYEDSLNLDESYLRLLSSYLGKDIGTVVIEREDRDLETNLFLLAKEYPFIEELYDELDDHINFADIIEKKSEEGEENKEAIWSELNGARFVVTDQLWFARLACLYGINHVFITEDERQVKPLKSLGKKLNILRLSDNQPKYFIGEDYEESLEDNIAATNIIIKVLKL